MKLRIDTDSQAAQHALVVVVLLAFAFMHIFTIANRSSAFGARSDVQHALLHWQGAAHHHHGDGSVGSDHSSESIEHVSLDGCLSAMAYQCVVPVEFAPRAVTPPANDDERARPWPYLDRLMRPPRFLV